MKKDIDAVFINPFHGGLGLNEATIIQPLGLAYMAAMLESNGYLCKIIDANVLRLSDKKIISQIPEKIRLVGIYVNSFTYDAVNRLTLLIRNRCKTGIIVLGGPLPTAAPDMVLTEIHCDGLIRGEGEYAILHIMQNISKGIFAFNREVSGACFFEQNTNMIVKNPLSRIKNLDALVFPAFHLLPHFNRYKRRNRKRPAAPIITSRGCTYECIFCSKDVFERQTTFRSAQNVFDEIDYLTKSYNIRQIDILDDNFVFKKSHTEAILDGIIERKYNIAINIQSGIRTELLDEPLLDKMKQAGVYKLAFGIESADDTVLNLCHKRIDVKRVAQVVHLAKDRGFLVYGFFIIGLPGETDEAFERTIKFARSLDFDVANFCMAIPFVGTELYRMVQKNGHFLIDTTRNINSGFYDGRVFYEYGGNTQPTIISRYKRAYKEFYSIKKKLQLLLNIRTFSEFRWLWDITIMILKGIFKRS